MMNVEIITIYIIECYKIAQASEQHKTEMESVILKKLISHSLVNVIEYHGEDPVTLKNIIDEITNQLENKVDDIFFNQVLQILFNTVCNNIGRTIRNIMYSGRIEIFIRILEALSQKSKNENYKISVRKKITEVYKILEGQKMFREVISNQYNTEIEKIVKLLRLLQEKNY